MFQFLLIIFKFRICEIMGRVYAFKVKVNDDV